MYSSPIPFDRDESVPQLWEQEKLTDYAKHRNIGTGALWGQELFSYLRQFTCNSNPIHDNVEGQQAKFWKKNQFN